LGDAEKKSSRVGAMVAYGMVGEPVWTPRRYEALAEEGYHRNTIVYRCVTLIARGLASVPWVLYRRDGGHEHELETHPILRLLNQPSPKEAGSAFMEAVVSSLLLSGNAYLEAVIGSAGKPVELHTLRSDRVKVVPGTQGLPVAYEYEIHGRKKRLPVDPATGRSSVLHIKTYHPLNDWYGMSPLEAAAPAIDQHNAVGAHNLALLQNGGRPSGALFVKSQNRLTDDQRDMLRQDLKRAYEGSHNAGRILMLEGDMEWKEMGLSPKDLDFVNGKHMAAREIAQAFGVPPMLVGVPGDATFANYKEARYHLWEDTIVPLLEFLVAELTMWLCPMFGERLRLGYDTDAIPALSIRRESLWAKVMQADFLTVNEKRAALGYGPLPCEETLAR
jgi:HK97 family phage portal protein